MRKIYVLMAAAAILMVGCKSNNGKKAAQDAEAAAVEQAEAYNQALQAVEEADEANLRDAVEKLSAADASGLVESVEETLAKNPDAVIPFAAVENKPAFEGGDANEFSKWVGQHVVYPESAIEDKVEGRVVLQFVVDKEGNVKDVKVVKGVNEVLDAEAVRVVESSPKWEAGTQAGIPVAVKYTFPVIFKLQ